MLRITRANTNENVERLRIEGRLTHADLPRLQESCAELLQNGSGLCLELSGLQFADHEAVATLQALRRRGVALIGASGFLDALLTEPPR